MTAQRETKGCERARSLDIGTVFEPCVEMYFVGTEVPFE